MVALAAAVTTPVFVGTPSQAAGETKSLKLYFVHTGEKAVITFKRNGKFDPKGLEQLNRFLRDWRKNQPTKMDPRLFDLIWEVYRQSGSHDYINVVCGFRSPDTNAMLKARSRNSGVAEKSQHMLGKAMDFFIPGVKLATLRAIGMKMQIGGVGFYPKSGSPFVHMDVGGVRAWPRMNRQELVSLFPDGKTLHIPADGKPLPGYQEAMADYKRRVGSTSIEIASSSDEPKKRGFFATLFGGGADETEDDNSDAPVAVAQATPSAKARPVAPVANEDLTAAPPAETEVASLNAPVPLVRPSFGSQQPGGSDMATALVSPQAGNAAQQALAAALPSDVDAQAKPETFADLSGYSIPVPALLGQRRAPGDADPSALVASADPAAAAVANNGEIVPVPVERPAVAEALLASADSGEDADEDQADDQQASLSAESVAALNLNSSDERAKMAAAAAAPSPSANEMLKAAMIGAAQQPKQASTEMASLMPSINGPKFGDSFDTPEIQEDGDGISAIVPTKGGRPTKHEADVATAGRATVRGEPKLTQKMISQWALTNTPVEISNRPVKAPRFVSQTLRAQPKAVYAEGFSVKTASIDPARFSGSAVNFLEVKKFDSTN